MAKSNLNTQETKIIDIYSARNSITNGTELNSVLKPLTNSDSPSDKSKGVRFVSAKAEIRSNNMTRNRKVHRGVYLMFCMANE